ncbi:MAG: hypothetical protein QNJ00_18080 [Woeseiaceae bacterium]|nr:hypothetical protein [Woeseiaceae bacterium]
MNANASIVYVDIDDTLVRSAGSKRIPIPHVVAAVEQMAAEGSSMFAWSSAGVGYAREVAAELGIEAIFAAFLPKPTLMIDDQEPSEWRYLTVSHPNELA